MRRSISLLDDFNVSISRRIADESVPLDSIWRLRKYNQASKESSGHGVEEKAPSTAEEFLSIAKEKERKIEECKRTVEKAQGAVKERCKEPIGKGNFHKRGDD
ncbi:hypothetical protein RJ639_038126 [Escallonia herrerae]|uniref:Uncharacterized protein n=1 Tax=Escallonia herrerae TaxID=1293975 RepID=A0AA88WM05_9ASTE|nr:hypothetical protein RJ639_038126 [Escallonia herrerae]